MSDTIEHAVKDFLAAMDHAHFVSKRTTGHGISMPTHTLKEEYQAWSKLREARVRLEKFL